MKAILKFDLPEDNDSFQNAVNGDRWSFLVNDTLQYIRGELKYNNELTEEQAVFLEKLRETIIEKMHEYNLSVD